jgi:two-component system phosphate regulon response regulator PhoB
LTIDSVGREVRVAGRPVKLSMTEFDLLNLLVANPGKVFSRKEIVLKTKGAGYPVTDRAVDVHIVSIRRKLDNAGGMIETVRGVGYRFAQRATGKE